MTEQEVAKAEALIKGCAPADLGIIVDNIGVDNGFSALYTPNAAMHTGFIQVGLTPGHSIGSYVYIARIKQRSGERDAGAESLLLDRQPGRCGGQYGRAGAHRYTDRRRRTCKRD